MATLVVEIGVVSAYPPAAVESEIIFQDPARTGAFDAYNTTLVFAACAEVGDRSAHAAKLASRSLARKLLRFVKIVPSQACVWLRDLTETKCGCDREASKNCFMIPLAGLLRLSAFIAVQLGQQFLRGLVEITYLCCGLLFRAGLSYAAVA